MYNQLLTQIGIRAATVQCAYMPTIGHVWLLVTIDGNRYFCDTTFELNFDEGADYQYFGQTYSQRVEDGLGSGGLQREDIIPVLSMKVCCLPLRFRFENYRDNMMDNANKRG